MPELEIVVGDDADADEDEDPHAAATIAIELSNEAPIATLRKHDNLPTTVGLSMVVSVLFMKFSFELVSD